MRNHVAAYWGFAAIFVLCSVTIVADANAQMFYRNLSFRELASQLETPEDIAHYVWQNFSFVTDREQFGREEYWQSPDELLESQKGDCEDFAVFAHQILRYKHITSFVLNIYGHQYAHTVCVFKENGKYSVIDGTHVIRFEASSVRELMTKIYPFWKTGAIVAPLGNSRQGQILTQFDHLVHAHERLCTSA
ncbi:MAG: transglutaminase-like cysteine peptidase [Candidatus Omnitrophica bacterium]|nr:transglutaminase-like cysteine peptidase [Candidatus Omnitrophota bacterium]